MPDSQTIHRAINDYIEQHMAERVAHHLFVVVPRWVELADRGRCAPDVSGLCAAWDYPVIPGFTSRYTPVPAF
jgi:hypothetical protein